MSATFAMTETAKRIGKMFPAGEGGLGGAGVVEVVVWCLQIQIGQLISVKTE
jgi:hypothetical protein